MRQRRQLVAACVGFVTLFFGSLFLFSTPGNGQTQESTKEDPLPLQFLTEVDPAFTQLFVRNYDACIANDMDLLEDLVSNINMIDAEQLQRRFSYVERMDHLTCYVAQGASADTYVVYVCGDLKIKGITQEAPTMSVFLVTRAYDNNLIIYLNAISKEESDRMEEMNASEPVKALIDETNQRMEQAMEADETLREFVDRLQLQ